jgi:hypothetical protein
MALQMLDGTGCLPSAIRTDGLVDLADPDEAPGFEITEEGLAALAESVGLNLQIASIAVE